ncbi:MAG TPA: hypothetical protein VF065_01295 [Ilumatobacter sp.]
MKLGIAIDDVQDAEMDLAKQLVALAEHHHDEPDVYHTSLARAHACAEHVWRLRPVVALYDAHAVDVEGATTRGFIDTLLGAGSAVAHIPATGLALLNDLRDTYVSAHRAEVSWIVLQQAARAARDGELLAVVGTCVEEAEQTFKWLRTRIKESAPAALASS